MTAHVGFVDNSSGYAHEALLAAIQTWAEAEGWTTMRSGVSPDSSGAPGSATYHKEWIGIAPGLSGGEQIIIGFRTYQDANNDYYNIAGMTATNYVAGNLWTAQPGISITSMCAHNQRIDYWCPINGQRITMGLKVGTPVYESGYWGKAFPTAPPSQFPYPVVSAGTLQGMPAVRYSDTSRVFPFQGNVNNLQLRTVGGAWTAPYVGPFNTDVEQYRDTNGKYHLTPLELMDSSLWPNGNVWAWLDGVYHITGFNNVVENTIVIDGVTYLVLQNIYRVGFNNYVAIALA